MNSPILAMEIQSGSLTQTPCTIAFGFKLAVLDISKMTYSSHSSISYLQMIWAEIVAHHFPNPIFITQITFPPLTVGTPYRPVFMHLRVAWLLRRQEESTGEDSELSQSCGLLAFHLFITLVLDRCSTENLLYLLLMKKEQHSSFHPKLVVKIQVVQTAHAQIQSPMVHICPDRMPTRYKVMGPYPRDWLRSHSPMGDGYFLS